MRVLRSFLRRATRRATPPSSVSMGIAEPLEPRVLLAGVDVSLGALAGRAFRQNTVLGPDTDVYRFSFARAGFVTIQLSRLIGHGSMALRSAGGIAIASTSASTDDQRITFQALGSGDFLVRVRADQSQFAPACAYTLAIATDFAPGELVGGSFDATRARNVGVLSETSANSFNDFLGFLDTSDRVAKDLVDVYQFDAPALGDIDFRLGVQTDVADGGAGVRADLTLFRDDDGDGRLESSESRGTSTASPGSVAQFLGNIERGRHFIVVSRIQPSANKIGGSNYSLGLGYQHRDLAGNTLANARSVNLGNVPISFRDLVSPEDTADIYRFNVPTSGGPFEIDARLLDIASGNPDLQLIRDANGNGTINAGDILVTSQAAGTNDERVERTLTVPGAYFVRVLRASGEGDYRLRMTLRTTDTAGGTLGTARDLGSLSGTIGVSEFVGLVDDADIFRFSVAQPGEVRISVGSPTNGSLAADVIRDVNGNGAIAATDVLARLAGGRVLDGVVLPVAGNYFVRFRPNAGADTGNYQATIRFSRQTPFIPTTPVQITNLAPVKIEAEHFDNGGDPDAYHDEDPENSGGDNFREDEGVDIKTTNDAGGGFRLATTAVGEFLEYTVNVVNAGSYDLDFRVASNNDGATFQLEVDGVNVTGTLAVPDTGGFDDMETVTRAGVFLTAGPHVLRLAMTGTTGQDNGFAGSYNFFTVRPTPGQTGTFSLSPAGSVVRPGARTTLDLEWTVPSTSGGWRALRTIDLKIRHPDGRDGVLWVRFDEAANTLRLFDPDLGRFGPARAIGSNNTLSNRFATVHLATTEVIADGPLDDSVVLSLDVSFKQKVAGRSFIIEAAATDDLGHRDAFDLAGGLNILKR